MVYMVGTGHRDIHGTQKKRGFDAHRLAQVAMFLGV